VALIFSHRLNKVKKKKPLLIKKNNGFLHDKFRQMENLIPNNTENAFKSTII